MRFIIVLTLLLNAVTLHCQVADTTSENKLKKYKQWIDSGLIDSTEYENLKEGVLQDLIAKVPDKTKPSQSEVKYKPHFVSGAILIPAGVFSITFSRAKQKRVNLTQKPNESVQEFNARLLNARNKYNFPIIFGSIQIVAGMIVTVVGIHKKVNLKKNKHLSLGILNNGNVGMAISF